MFANNMHLTQVLKNIYQEHGQSVPLMVETLLDLEVPTQDAILLGALPWEFPANRIAVERERLGFSPVRPLLHFKLSSPPRLLTPALIVKMFDLALQYQSEEDDEEPPGRSTILPA